MNCCHYPICVGNFVVRLCAIHLMSLVLDPAALLPDCVLNQYKSYPEFAVTILNAIKQKEIHFFLWESRMVLVTKRNKENKVVSSNKQVLSLHPFTETLENTILRLKKMLANLKRHIATLQRQWDYDWGLPDEPRGKIQGSSYKHGIFQ